MNDATDLSDQKSKIDRLMVGATGCDIAIILGIVKIPYMVLGNVSHILGS